MDQDKVRSQKLTFHSMIRNPQLVLNLTSVETVKMFQLSAEYPKNVIVDIGKTTEEM